VIHERTWGSGRATSNAPASARSWQASPSSLARRNAAAGRLDGYGERRSATPREPGPRQENPLTVARYPAPLTISPRVVQRLRPSCALIDEAPATRPKARGHDIPPVEVAARILHACRNYTFYRDS